MADQLQILLQLDDFLSCLKETESTQRAFLLTGDPFHLASYTNRSENVRLKLNQLQTFVASGNLEKDEINRLSELTPQRLSELDRIINVRREKDFEVVLAAIRESEPNNLLRQIEAETASARAREEGEFFAADRRARHAENFRTKAFVASSLLNVALFFWGFRRVSSDMKRQQQGISDMARLQKVGVRCMRAGNAVTDSLQEIVHTAIDLTQASKGIVQLSDHRGNLRIAAQQGFDQRFLESVSSDPLESPFAFASAIESAQSVEVRDVANSTVIAAPLIKLLVDAHVRALLSAPLISSSGKALGIISIQFSVLHCPTESQRQLINLLARQTAEYLERKGIEQQLQSAHDQLADRAIHLEGLVQERTARLQEMIGDLEAFSYSIVHDMRAPLRAMQSFAQLLVEDYGPLNPTAGMYVNRIQTAASRLDLLIQDGLNFSRYMRHDLPLGPVDVGALLRGILETYPAFHGGGAKIELIGKFPIAYANEAALTQCISNLLDNAIKFVAADVTPKIDIWAETTEGRIFLFFKDNGVGIKTEAYEKIFKIFQRLDQKHEGTGIGLAIVKKAAERMGGSVGLQSERGKGSTFWIELASTELNNQEAAKSTRSSRTKDWFDVQHK